MRRLEPAPRKDRRGILLQGRSEMGVGAGGIALLQQRQSKIRLHVRLIRIIL